MWIRSLGLGLDRGWNWGLVYLGIQPLIVATVLD